MTTNSLHTDDLLIELGTEELPPKALKKLSTAFSNGIVEGLKKAGFEINDIESFATPRRLAVLIKDIADSQPDRDVERKGPSLKAAYDADGNPTKAVMGLQNPVALMWMSCSNRKPIRVSGWFLKQQKKARHYLTSSKTL